ncbi:unnamed protein product, partial [Ectocarpus sp. 12 AP-2014]
AEQSGGVIGVALMRCRNSLAVIGRPIAWPAPCFSPSLQQLDGSDGGARRPRWFSFRPSTNHQQPTTQQPGNGPVQQSRRISTN